jgi:hypothetical protein
MKLFLLWICFGILSVNIQAQSSLRSPCGSDPVYRQFDFWIGNWEAFGPKGKKAGDSKISLILDSCVVLEEWISVQVPGQFQYSGKSFNTYNAQTMQWQQNWVDNTGVATHYLLGKAENDRIVFQTIAPNSNDTTGINRLTFFRLSDDKVRQLGEVSKDQGKTWVTQYDLEYRRKK